MASKTIIIPEAWEEIDAAFEWYERQEAGLGERFFSSLKHSIDMAMAQPELYPTRFEKSAASDWASFPMPSISSATIWPSTSTPYFMNPETLPGSTV